MALSLFYDETITRSESARFLYKFKNEIKKLVKTTAFNNDEIANLLIIHHKITKSGGPINRQRFKEFCSMVLGIKEQRHFEKIYGILDPRHKSAIPPHNWAKAMSVWLRGDLNQQIQFVWAVYLPLKEDFLTRDTIRNYLKPTVVKKDAAYESTLQELVGELLRKLDKDNDGKVSFTDFKKSVLQNPLLLECLGQCLPSHVCAEAFYVTFSNRPMKLRLFNKPRSYQ